MTAISVLGSLVVMLLTWLARDRVWLPIEAPTVTKHWVKITYLPLIFCGLQIRSPQITSPPPKNWKFLWRNLTIFKDFSFGHRKGAIRLIQ